MKRIMPIILLILIITALSVAEESQQILKVRDSMLLTTLWLSENLDNPSILIFHVGTQEEYEKGHIPGAHFFPIREIFAPPTAGLNHEMPPIAKLDSVFSSIGVYNDSKIVLYHGKDWLPVAARVYLTLDYLGLGEETAMLDGGLAQWVAEGRPTEIEKADVKVGNFTPKVNRDLLIKADWLEGNLRNPGIFIVDSRSAEFYDGDEKEEYIERYGHITGAVSIPFPEVITASPPDRFKDIGELQQIFLKAGVKPGSIVVTYCNTGIWACPVFFAAKYLGYDARFYDGGFEEWSATEDYSITEPVNITPLN